MISHDHIIGLLRMMLSSGLLYYKEFPNWSYYLYSSLTNSKKKKTSHYID